jgi:hypothetical protein
MCVSVSAVLGTPATKAFRLCVGMYAFIYRVHFLNRMGEMFNETSLLCLRFVPEAVGSFIEG